MKMYRLFIILILLTSFSSCHKTEKEKQEELPNPKVDASYTYSLSNNGIVPCKLSVSANNKSYYWYNWKFNNSNCLCLDTASFMITEEGYYPLELNVPNGNASDTQRDTLIIYSEDFAKAVELSKDSIYCDSFQYNGMMFKFSDLDEDQYKFDDTPKFLPEDLGKTLYQMHASIDKKNNATLTGNLESGASILFIDVAIKTEKVDIKQKLKIYTFYSSSCLQSVKVFDYFK